MRTGARQRGVALVLAMLVVALGTLLSATVARALFLDLRRANQLVTSAQAYEYARGLAGWAGLLLADDYRTSGAVDHRGEPWAKGVPFLDVPGGRLTGRLVDLDGRFNLNNLVIDGVPQPRQLAIFRRLLELLRLDPSIAEGAADWVDPDVMPSPRGAEDPAYLRLRPPYRTANQPFTDVSELRAVAGVDAEAFARLEPHVTALPTRGAPTTVNVNTTTPAVVAALHDGINLAMAEDLVDPEGPRHESVDQFLNEPRLELLETSELRTLLTVESRFFAAEALIELDDTVHRFELLLERDRTRVYLRRFGRGAL